LPEDVARSDWTLVSYIGFAITFVPRGGPMRSLRTVSVAIALSATACAFPFSTSSSDSNALDGEIGADHEDGEERGWQVGDDDDSDGDDGCTLTQGYWKNHSDRESGHRNIAWPIDEDTDLCGTTWLDNLGIAPQGNAFYILSHQYIAASLNVAASAVAPPDVSAALDEAESLMADCQITDAERARAVELAGVLDDSTTAAPARVTAATARRAARAKATATARSAAAARVRAKATPAATARPAAARARARAKARTARPSSPRSAPSIPATAESTTAHAGSGGEAFTGNRTVNAAPPRSFRPASMLPPCSTTMRCASARPRPVPRLPFVVT
jgi:hypothetical protein